MAKTGRPKGEGSKSVRVPLAILADVERLIAFHKEGRAYEIVPGADPVTPPTPEELAGFQQYMDFAEQGIKWLDRLDGTPMILRREEGGRIVPVSAVLEFFDDAGGYLGRELWFEGDPIPPGIRKRVNADDYSEDDRDELVGDLIESLSNDMEDAGYILVTDMMDVFTWRDMMNEWRSHKQEDIAGNRL